MKKAQIVPKTNEGSSGQKEPASFKLMHRRAIYEWRIGDKSVSLTVSSATLLQTCKQEKKDDL
jgi:hypothetical protein